MQPTETLRNDHAVLRGKLMLLEGLLPLGRAAYFPLRDVAYSLTRRLRCHIEKEERLLLLMQQGAFPHPLAPVSALLDEHRDQRVTVALLLELVINGSTSSIDQIVLCASHLIDSLRGHMAREEAEIFPFVEQTMTRNQKMAAMQDMRAIAARYYPEGEPAPWPSDIDEHLVNEWSSPRHVVCAN